MTCWPDLLTVEELEPGFRELVRRLSSKEDASRYRPAARLAAQPKGAKMHVRTLLRYLTGDRQAILQLASDRRALGVGLLFVLSAGLAREYDGEDLLHEPWHVLIPLGASLVSSFLLFVLTWGVTLFKKTQGPSFFSAYLSFLGLFWLTAPLAWFYAVPYERFLSPADAVRANLWTLGLVACWRVALMVRVVSVLMGYKLGAALTLVMLFSSGVALALLQFVPFPIIQVMGGIRLSESEQLLQATAFSPAVRSCSGWFSGKGDRGRKAG